MLRVICWTLIAIPFNAIKILSFILTVLAKDYCSTTCYRCGLNRCSLLLLLLCISFMCFSQGDPGEPGLSGEMGEKGEKV